MTAGVEMEMVKADKDDSHIMYMLGTALVK